MPIFLKPQTDGSYVTDNTTVVVFYKDFTQCFAQDDLNAELR